MSERIGQSVRRTGRDGTWHRVESEIAGAAVTRCGRRMEPLAQRGAALTFSPLEPKPECLVCRLGVGQ